MTYLIDTDVCIEYLRGNNEVVDFILDQDPVYVSIITYAELSFGVEKSQNKKKHQKKLDNFMMGVESINLDKNICQRYAQTKTNLIKKGKPTGDFDLLIACTCLEYNLTLTTRNLKHYENIDQLKTSYA